ncbi:hypothetical protein N9N67_04945 [Bacteriovoracaceae bacterium]|nr:hypothetical protein [Bacteriovoracaceae bacterium]
MFVKYLLLFFLVSITAVAQTEYSLDECTFHLTEFERLNPPGNARLLPLSGGVFSCPRYEEDPGPYINTVSPFLYNNSVITCAHGGGSDVGCRARQVCNYTGANPMCEDMTASREASSGFTLFDDDVNRSGCLITNPATTNLNTIPLEDITFANAADGTTEHCLDIIRLYRLQRGRAGAGGSTTIFNLPTSSSGP